MRNDPTMRINVHRTLAALTGGVAMIAAIGGCSWFGGSSDDKHRGDAVTTRPTMGEASYSSERPLPTALQPINRPVDQGQLPLTYLIEGPGVHRVVNVASGEEIATFDAKSGQIVRVESRGVLLENKSILGAQLLPGVYAIERVEAGSGNLVAEQTRTVPVAPKPQPASRPTAPPAPAATPPPTDMTPSQATPPVGPPAPASSPPMRTPQ